ncbi:MAG TPA: signal peptidase I [Fimbriimonadaceae bacterium]|nr:signal peptidase I [Fimbriimonadaceae bacterium]
MGNTEPDQITEELTGTEPTEGHLLSEQGRKPISRRTYIVSGFFAFLVFLFAVALFFFYNFQTIEVRGNSMEPTLEPGRRLLISKAYWLIGPIKKGDIVVLNNKRENDVLIKRVYALGGDKVDLQNVPENWRLTNGDYYVPKGKIYVLGDNLPVSEDSRHYGPFDLKDVLGKVVVVQSAIGSSGNTDN